MRTRAWRSCANPDTGVLFRTDAEPMVWLHTNIGWIPVGNAPTNSDEAEEFAQGMADGYELVECHHSEALYLVGVVQ